MAPSVAEPQASSKILVVAEGSGQVPLQMVLRPGVLLTKRGIQLRPVIARLGQEVEAYRVLWEALRILRTLPASTRATVMTMLRGLEAEDTG